MKNLEELKKQGQNQRNTRQQKSLKARDNPKIFKEYSLLHSEKTPHKELPSAIINDAKCVI